MRLGTRDVRENRALATVMSVSTVSPGADTRKAGARKRSDSWTQVTGADTRKAGARKRSDSWTQVTTAIGHDIPGLSYTCLKMGLGWLCPASPQDAYLLVEVGRGRRPGPSVDVPRPLVLVQTHIQDVICRVVPPRTPGFRGFPLFPPRGLILCKGSQPLRRV